LCKACMKLVQKGEIKVAKPRTAKK
jgi:hypothetical protein